MGLPRCARNDKKGKVLTMTKKGAQNDKEGRFVILVCLNGNLQTVYFTHPF